MSRTACQVRSPARPLDTIDRLRRLDYLAQAASIGRALIVLWMMSLVVDEKNRLIRER
jgi:hypothetical protein